MPNYKGHLAGGSCAYAIGIVLVILVMLPAVPSLTTAAEWLFFALVGSLFPDIDTKSKIQKYFYWTMLLLVIFLIARNKRTLVMLLSIVSLVPLLVKHRGLFHRTWFIVGMPMLVCYGLCSCFPASALIIRYDMFFFVLGALSHLWLDLGWQRMLRL